MITNHNNNDVTAQDVCRWQIREYQAELPGFERTDRVEWNSSTKALVEFLAAVDVSDAGTAARLLTQEFGNLSDLLTASWWTLQRVVGRRLARTILASHALMKAMLEERIMQRPVVPRSKELVDLLQAEIGFLKHERLLALYVDSRCRLMRIERLADGGLASAPVDKRTIIGCAIAIGASGFILVHNHPSGLPEPSSADLAITTQLKQLAAEFDVDLLDHFIIARGRFASIEDLWREAESWATQDTFGLL